MITGCNSLLSQQFGTQRLRTIPIEEAGSGVGDADFIRLTGARLADSLQQYQMLQSGESSPVYHFWPIESVDGEFYNIIAFWNSEKAGCVDPINCPPPTDRIEGLVGPPSEVPEPSSWVHVAAADFDDLVYLQLGQAPLAWYWNLLLFVGGIALAAGSQYRDFRARRKVRKS